MKRAALLILLTTAVLTGCNAAPEERKPVASVDLIEPKGDCRTDPV